MGVVRSCDSLKNVGGSYYITGTAEPKVVKFCTWVGYINSRNSMTKGVVMVSGHVTVGLLVLYVKSPTFTAGFTYHF